ncbi:hypothetical protein GCM10022419_046710 [Nonomuraea rosea]|uniref:DUF4342 domain-containing protein n=1 Tax=Nonomuraea rosea TaxID=638574 RepID=A0ABP6X343_9ACTN
MTIVKEEAVKEEGRVRTSELAGKVRKAIHEGNVRRIIVTDASGHSVMEIPMTVGAVAAIAAPVVTAAAALAALAAEWTIRVERRTQEENVQDIKDVPKGKEKAPAE